MIAVGLIKDKVSSFLRLVKSHLRYSLQKFQTGQLQGGLQYLEKTVRIQFQFISMLVAQVIDTHSPENVKPEYCHLCWHALTSRSIICVRMTSAVNTM